MVYNGHGVENAGQKMKDRKRRTGKCIASYLRVFSVVWRL